MIEAVVTVSGQRTGRVVRKTQHAGCAHSAVSGWCIDKPCDINFGSSRDGHGCSYDAPGLIEYDQQDENYGGGFVSQEFLHYGHDEHCGQRREKTEVSSFADYARVVRHLEGLSIIESVSVEELRDDQLIIGLTTRGRGDVLDRALTLGDVLRPVSGPAANPMAVGLDRITARYFRVLH